MAAGRPIVASDVPVVREVLCDGDNALLVPAEEPKAWASAVQRLHDDPKLCRHLGRHAAADARRYTWKVRGQQILEFAQAVTANDECRLSGSHRERFAGRAV